MDKKTVLLIVAMCLLVPSCVPLLAPLIARRAAPLVARRIGAMVMARAAAQAAGQALGQSSGETIKGTGGQDQGHTGSSQEERSPAGGDEPPLGTYRVTRDTKLFREPREDADPITWLPSGTKVNVVGIVGGKWLRIEFLHLDNPPAYLRREDTITAPQEPESTKRG